MYSKKWYTDPDLHSNLPPTLTLSHKEKNVNLYSQQPTVSHNHPPFYNSYTELTKTCSSLDMRSLDKILSFLYADVMQIW